MRERARVVAPIGKRGLISRSILLAKNMFLSPPANTGLPPAKNSCPERGIHGLVIIAKRKRGHEQQCIMKGCEQKKARLCVHWSVIRFPLTFCLSRHSNRAT